MAQLSFLTWSKYYMRYRAYMFGLGFVFRLFCLVVLSLVGWYFFARAVTGNHLPSLTQTLRSTPSFRTTALRAVNGTDGSVTVYAPSTNIERIDYEMLSEATGNIDIAMYSFTDRFLAEAIIKAANNGATIRIYRDGEQFQQEQNYSTNVTSLFKGISNIHIKVKPASRFNLMHLKSFCTGTILRDGSANFSNRSKIQDNNARYTKDSQQIKEFEDNFNSLWNRPSNITIQ